MKPSLYKNLQKRDSYCWHCGATADLVPHHRKNRGMGGSRNLDVLSNLVLVCSLYNGAMESDSTVQSTARELGHKLRQSDLLSKPLFDNVGKQWFTLDNEGNKIAVSQGSSQF